MEDEKKQELIPMSQTFITSLDSEKPSLPQDTARELQKGIHWVNTLLEDVLNERFQEELEDRNGERHSQTHFHPLTMKLMEEQRKRIDQMWKILGGEARNEALKDVAKLTAKAIFQASQNQESKRKHKEDAIEILEADVYEED